MDREHRNSDGCEQPSQATRNKWYWESAYKLVTDLKRKGGYSDENARGIVIATLKRVWDEHGKWIDPATLGDGFLRTLARDMATRDVRQEPIEEQLVPPDVLARSLPVESHEDYVLARVDAERAQRIQNRDGRWRARGVVAILAGLAALSWVKRIAAKIPTVATAGVVTAAAAAVTSLIVVQVPDDGAVSADRVGRVKAPIVRVADTPHSSERGLSQAGAAGQPLRSLTADGQPHTASSRSAEKNEPVASELDLAADTGPGRKQSSRAVVETPVGVVGVASVSDADGPAIGSSACVKLAGGCPGAYVAEGALTTDGTPTP